MKNIEFFWKQADFKPNEKQRSAILHEGGPLFLTSGPGSGKTRVLLWRTLNLIVYKGVSPAEIFLSTFTEKAAQQLKDGLRTLLGFVTNASGLHFDLSAMSIGTVHSLCQRLLIDRRFNPDQSRRRSPNLLDELAQYFRIYNRRYWNELLDAGGYDDEEAAQREINEFFIGKDLYSRHIAVQNCISLFNRFSEENLDPASVKTKDEMLQSLLRMYAKYTLDLATEDKVVKVDFSLLQSRAFDYFLESEKSKSVFQHVIVDEFQDTNSIQEKIFFHLATGHKNICVVGDDDQALYRFRGATVENLVEFEDRCKRAIGVAPTRIDLSTNYRSRKNIVDFYTDFMNRADWSRPGKRDGYFRIQDKQIKANSKDSGVSVVTTEKQKAEEVYSQIAKFVKQLKKKGVVSDYNQIAFLFPAMKSMGGMNSRVRGFTQAFLDEGIPFYAPRAGRFLEQDESMVTFGLFQMVIGHPKFEGRGFSSQGYREFQNWTSGCRQRVEEIVAKDSMLASFVKDRGNEYEAIQADYALLEAFCQKKNWKQEDPVKPGVTVELVKISGLSLRTQKNLRAHLMNQNIAKRAAEGKPFDFRYLLNRVTALDWTILDLFYQLNSFAYFRDLYKLAETGEDEGPICNLGLITQYLARFMEEYTAILTGQAVIEERFLNRFFKSFLYALFRLGESEFENPEDPFPKGRVSFLTIHQSKGLEFPVVVLGSVYREDRDAGIVEESVRQLLRKEGEPLDRIGKYDSMRIFYVGLSRAKNLLVLPQYTHGKAATPEFKAIFEEGKISKIDDLDLASVPRDQEEDQDLGNVYSYTGDYLHYKRCARNYMVFRKYGFVPSHSQTMFFGRLVHETIEDIHNHVMAQKGK